MKNHLFVFGLGNTGAALAQELSMDGWKISGTTRETHSHDELKAKGYNMFRFDDTTDLNPCELEDVSHILISIPPSDAGDMVYLKLAQNFVERSNAIKWIGYLSTTGVYGDRQGGWVDEASALTPSTKRGEKRLQAEKAWLGLFKSHQLPVHIFRLAGIYGPGSNQLEKVVNGTARRRIKPGQIFSRIHVEDIVGMLTASMIKPNPGTAYNICDDEAAPPQDVVTYAAKLLNVEPPDETDFNPDEMTPMGLSFFAESKRVSNQRVKSELGYQLKYPTYREGLKALLKSVSQRK